MHFHGVIRAIGGRWSLLWAGPTTCLFFPHFTMTSIKSIHGVTAGNISSHPSAHPFCGIYIDMIVFDNAFQRLDMNFFYISQVNTASTGMRPPGGKSGGKAFMKELHTIRQDGTQCGAGEGVRAQTRLRDILAAPEACLCIPAGGARQPGKDPKYISHGRASGRLHYRALDTKMSSNEKARSNPPASIVAITFQTQSPFQ